MKQQYTDEMLDAVCHILNDYPAGCTTRQIGEALYPLFHPDVDTEAIPKSRLAGKQRDWARGCLQRLELEEHVYQFEDGRTVRYGLLEDMEEDVDELEDSPDCPSFE